MKKLTGEQIKKRPWGKFDWLIILIAFGLIGSWVWIFRQLNLWLGVSIPITSSFLIASVSILTALWSWFWFYPRWERAGLIKSYIYIFLLVGVVIASVIISGDLDKTGLIPSKFSHLLNLPCIVLCAVLTIRGFLLTFRMEKTKIDAIRKIILYIGFIIAIALRSWRSLLVLVVTFIIFSAVSLYKESQIQRKEK